MDVFDDACRGNGRFGCDGFSKWKSAVVKRENESSV